MLSTNNASFTRSTLCFSWLPPSGWFPTTADVDAGSLRDADRDQRPLWLDVLRWRPPRVLIAAIAYLFSAVHRSCRDCGSASSAWWSHSCSHWCLVHGPKSPGHRRRSSCRLHDQAADGCAASGVVLALGHECMAPAMAFARGLRHHPCHVSWPRRADPAGMASLLPRRTHRLSELFSDDFALVPRSRCLGRWSIVRNRHDWAAGPRLAKSASRCRSRNSRRRSRHFRRRHCRSALVSPFNQVLLLLPAMAILRDWAALPRLGRRVFSAIVAWPWIAFVLLLLHPRWIQRTHSPAALSPGPVPPHLRLCSCDMERNHGTSPRGLRLPSS